MYQYKFLCRLMFQNLSRHLMFLKFSPARLTYGFGAQYMFKFHKFLMFMLMCRSPVRPLSQLPLDPS